MSLTQSDFQEIRTIFREEISSLDGRVAALESDVKEIYHMIARMETAQQSDKKFIKLDVEQKIKNVYKDLQTTAKQAGVTLPRP